MKMLFKIRDKFLSLIDYGLSLRKEDSNRDITLKILSLLFILNITLSCLVSFIQIISFLFMDIKVLIGLTLTLVICFIFKPNVFLKLKEIL